MMGGSGVQRRSRKLRSRAVFFVVALGVAAVCFMSGDTLWTRLTMVLADTHVEPVPVCTAEKGSYTVTVPAHGEISGVRSELIQAPRTRSGALTLSWLVSEGNYVEAGEPLVRFDSTDAKLSIEKQENALAANKERFKIAREAQKTDETSLGLDLASARLDYQYAMDALPADKAIFSKWDIMEAEMDADLARLRTDYLKQNLKVQERIDEADLQILRIDKNQAEQEMEIAQKTLDSMELDSPVSGFVVYHRHRGREPEIGDRCWPGQVLVEVVDLTELQARLYVLERDAGGLKAGMEAVIRLDPFPDRSFTGVIESVSPLAQPLESNSPLLYFTCETKIDMAREDLQRVRPGMRLQADITKEKYNSCLVVPANAVTEKGGEKLVYIHQDDNFIPRSVETAPGPHGQTVILSGIADGEVVALRNPFEVRQLYLPDFGKAQSSNRMPSRRMIYFRRR
jgi:HlyD family secretion protein